MDKTSANLESFGRTFFRLMRSLRMGRGPPGITQIDLNHSRFFVDGSISVSACGSVPLNLIPLEVMRYISLPSNPVQYTTASFAEDTNWTPPKKNGTGLVVVSCRSDDDDQDGLYSTTICDGQGPIECSNLFPALF